MINEIQLCVDDSKFGFDFASSCDGFQSVTEVEANGVGSLLAMMQGSGSDYVSYYFADANGNITRMYGTSDQELASYRYNPFGNITNATGSWASQYRYQWSSKENDAATGLVYYLYRFYSPELGRWVNKDRIGERGGKNLYAALLNEPISKLDYLGLNVFLQARVDRIEVYLAADDEDGASKEAYLLYINLTTGGQFLYPFANEMMEYWLNNTKTKMTLNSSRVKELVMDQEVSKLFRYSMSGISGVGRINHSALVAPARNTDNFYALGTFTLSFNGKYCVKGGKIDLNGTWNISDKYDWHKGLSVTVQGVVIKDEYALLVEQSGRAKSYDVDGEWSGRLTVFTNGAIGAVGR